MHQYANYFQGRVNVHSNTVKEEATESCMKQFKMILTKLLCPCKFLLDDVNRTFLLDIFRGQLYQNFCIVNGGNFRKSSRTEHSVPPYHYLMVGPSIQLSTRNAPDWSAPILHSDGQKQTI